ncbi:MAG: hypothetical protein AAFO04_12570 [Cyanobacteria bacterium J06592_8]
MMDVQNRWQHFAENPQYRKLLNNPELLRYSQQIFGQIPGTELLNLPQQGDK